MYSSDVICICLVLIVWIMVLLISQDVIENTWRSHPEHLHYWNVSVRLVCWWSLGWVQFIWDPDCDVRIPLFSSTVALQTWHHIVIKDTADISIYLVTVPSLSIIVWSTYVAFMVNSKVKINHRQSNLRHFDGNQLFQVNNSSNSNTIEIIIIVLFDVCNYFIMGSLTLLLNVTINPFELWPNRCTYGTSIQLTISVSFQNTASISIYIYNSMKSSSVICLNLFQSPNNSTDADAV